MTKIEYGIRHANRNEMYAQLMSKEEAIDWIKYWELNGGNPGAFIIVYREFMPWQEFKE